MKLQIVSDTHNNIFSLDMSADIVIHAGDFSNGLKGVHQFINYCKANKKDFIFCLGNHDYYGEEFFAVEKHLLEYFPNNFLSYNNTVERDGLTFVGGTLFSNFRSNTGIATQEIEQNKLNASRYINDFRVIRYNDKIITTEDYQILFDRYLENIDMYRNKKDVVVVTHFPIHIGCLDPKWDNPRDGVVNSYFINDINIKGFETVISGHTHTHFDYVSDGCRVIVNPVGYPLEQTGYIENFIIEV